MPFHTGTCECSRGVFLHEEKIRLGGSVHGLSKTSKRAGLVLQSSSPLMVGTHVAEHGEAAMQVLIDRDGMFMFPHRLAYGQNFKVSVVRQPQHDAQHCTVDMGGLGMEGVEWWGPAYVDIMDLTVTCHPTGKVSSVNGNTMQEAQLRSQAFLETGHAEKKKNGLQKLIDVRVTKHGGEVTQSHDSPETATAGSLSPASSSSKSDNSGSPSEVPASINDDASRACDCFDCDDNKMLNPEPGKTCIGFSLACGVGASGRDLCYGRAKPGANSTRAPVSGTCACHTGIFTESSAETVSVKGNIEGLEEEHMLVLVLSLEVPSLSGEEEAISYSKSPKLFSRQTDSRSKNGDFEFPLKFPAGIKYSVQVVVVLRVTRHKNLLLIFPS